MSQPTIQRGTKSFADTLTSMTIVRGTDPGFDTTVDPTKTLVLLTWNTPGTNASNWPCYALRWALTDGDTITVDRFTAPSDGNAVSVSWALYSFPSGVTVQHKTLAASAAGSGTIAVTSVGADLTHSFIIQNGVVAPGVFPERNAIEWKFDSTTQISWARDVASGNVASGCQVVTMDFATVQAVSVTATTSTATTFDTAISAATIASSMIFGSVRITGTVDLTAAALTATLTTTTNLRLARNTGTSMTLHGTIYVITFTDTTSVARYTPAHSAGTASVDTTITSVDTAVTLLNPSAMTGGLPAGRAPNATFGRELAVMTFQAATTLRTVKGIGSSAADYQVEVVEFAASGPSPASCSPNNCPVAGGVAVTITGSGFDASGGSSEGVTFGGTAATDVVFVNSTTITCTAPAHAAGLVDVVVTNGNAATGTLTNGFRFTLGPAITTPMGPTNGSGVAPDGSLTSDIALDTTAGAYLEIIATNEARGTLYTSALPKTP